MSIGNYTPVREDDEFEIDGEVWVVDEVVTDDVHETQCFLVPDADDEDRCRQYTEQDLIHQTGIDRL